MQPVFSTRSLGGNWNINNIIQDSNSNSYIESDINKIYQYLHNILRILGDDNDDNDKNDEMHPWKFHHFFLQTIRIPKNNHASLLRICQIAYNIGQLSVYINKKYIYIPTFFKNSSSLPNIFRKNAVKYYYKNKIYKITLFLYVIIIKMIDLDSNRYKFGIDLLLSYWILLWYFLYMIGIMKTSPKMSLSIALFANTLMIIEKLNNKESYTNILLFIFIQAFIKAIPIYTLRKTKIKYIRELIILFGITMLYLLWLYINNTDVFSVYTYIKHPLINLINYMIN